MTAPETAPFFFHWIVIRDLYQTEIKSPCLGLVEMR